VLLEPLLDAVDEFGGAPHVEPDAGAGGQVTPVAQPGGGQGEAEVAGAEAGHQHDTESGALVRVGVAPHLMAQEAGNRERGDGHVFARQGSQLCGRDHRRVSGQFVGVPGNSPVASRQTGRPSRFPCASNRGFQTTRGGVS
jgi:hypothetical protein